jgi:hypothetical protein
MRRHLPGLHSHEVISENSFDGLFLTRVAQASYTWHAHKTFLTLKFVVLAPASSASQSFSARLYCTERALWKLNWFLSDFGYDMELLSRDQIDEKALVGLRGVVRTSPVALNGRSYQNLDGFAPALDWDDTPADIGNAQRADGHHDDL